MSSLCRTKVGRLCTLMAKFVLMLILFLPFGVSATEVDVQSGDIIFQTSSSKQSYAIMWASKSLYSHVGIVEVYGKKKFVIEAISKVSRTPLDKWIKRGRLGRYAVFRFQNLDVKKRQEIVTHAKTYLGFGYDVYFTSKNKEIYCSELVDLAFEKSGMKVGKKQKVKELDVDNMVVRKLVEKRWRKHPVCKGRVKKFEDCWVLILEDELVAPESLAADSQFAKIWSNYP